MKRITIALLTMLLVVGFIANVALASAVPFVDPSPGGQTTEPGHADEGTDKTDGTPAADHFSLKYVPPIVE